MSLEVDGFASDPGSSDDPLDVETRAPPATFGPEPQPTTYISAEIVAASSGDEWPAIMNEYYPRACRCGWNDFNFVRSLEWANADYSSSNY